MQWGFLQGMRFCPGAQAVQLIDLQLFRAALLNQRHLCPFPVPAGTELQWAKTKNPASEKKKKNQNKNTQKKNPKKTWLNFYLTKYPTYAISSVNGKFCTNCLMCLSPGWKMSILEVLQAVCVAQKMISWACVTFLSDFKDYQWLGWWHSQRPWVQLLALWWHQQKFIRGWIHFF